MSLEPPNASARVTRLGLVRAAALVLLALGLTAPGETAPAAVPEAAQHFRLGAFDLYALRDALNIVPNDGSVFGKDKTPAEVAQVLKTAGEPTDRLTLGVDALLVRMPGHLVLIDTGLGPKVHGALPESLARAGADAATITDVLITHSHGDHVGGLLTAGGGLAFPAATIRMSSVEWAWLKSQSGMSALSAAIAPKVSTFVAGAAVLPGIFSVSIPGHTPGHVGYEISSRGKRLLDMGDSAHSSIVSLARPEWVIGYDKDPELGRSERLATLKRLAASHEPVFAPHFPFPGVGTIGAKGDGFVWKPGLP